MPYKNPEDRAAAQRRRRADRRGLTGGSPGGPPGDDPPDAQLAGDAESVPPLPIRTAADVLAVIEEAINAVRGDRRANPQVKARSIGFLCSVALKSIEVGDLAAQLAELKKQFEAKP